MTIPQESMHGDIKNYGSEAKDVPAPSRENHANHTRSTVYFPGSYVAWTVYFTESYSSDSTDNMVLFFTQYDLPTLIPCWE